MTWKFGTRSLANLETCDDRLQSICHLALTRSPIDLTVLEGHRTAERQEMLFRSGMSKLDGVTKKSRHQSDPSQAVDIAPYPIDWDDAKRFYHVAGVIISCAHELDIPIRFGGDWDGDGSFKDQRFHDLPHFELA